MKEKLEKKEKERQLKANNSKKSDEALRNLYYKVVDEAFQINKNRIISRLQPDSPHYGAG